MLQLQKYNIDEYVIFVDSIVKAFVPSEVIEPVLFQLVTAYQADSYSSSQIQKWKVQIPFLEIFHRKHKCCYSIAQRLIS